MLVAAVQHACTGAWRGGGRPGGRPSRRRPPARSRRRGGCRSSTPGYADTGAPPARSWTARSARTPPGPHTQRPLSLEPGHLLEDTRTQGTGCMTAFQSAESHVPPDHLSRPSPHDKAEADCCIVRKKCAGEQCSLLFSWHRAQKGAVHSPCGRRGGEGGGEGGTSRSIWEASAYMAAPSSSVGSERRPASCHLPKGVPDSTCIPASRGSLAPHTIPAVRKPTLQFRQRNGRKSEKFSRHMLDPDKIR